MLFSSPFFLFFFFPIVVLIYLLINNLKIKNIFLIIVSVIFYFLGEGYNILILIFSVLVNYYFANKILLSLSFNKKKLYLFFGILFNILLLAFYKYYNFFINNLNFFFNFFLISINLKNAKIDLPIGISFYTFQSISLIIDIFRDKNQKKINLSTLFLYITLFPQLIAGPIIRFNEFKNQMRDRIINHLNIYCGIELFIIGLAKKLIIADSFGVIADDIFDDRVFDIKFSHLSMLMAWTGAIAFFIQIYFDFSGYSDMAIGLLRIFGFQIQKNFNYPYSSLSITEFWTKWHISLSSWFKDYLYIPLGGNRCGVIRNSINLFLVFFLCGLWHGTSYNFIIWGLYHGFFLSIEKIIRKNIFLSPGNSWIVNLISWLYTFIIILIGWVIFRGNNINESLHIIKTMFDFQSSIQFWSINQILTNQIIFLLFCAGIGSFKIYDKLFNYFPKIKLIFLTLIFFMSLTYLSSNTFNPFIYFRF